MPKTPTKTPQLGTGMSTGKAQGWIIVSAIVTGGMYFLRRMVETADIGTSTSKSKIEAVLGSGAPPALETWLLAYGITYFGLAIMAMAAPELAAAFAILVLAVNGINNGVTVAADIGGLEGGGFMTPTSGAHATTTAAAAPTAVKTSAGTTAVFQQTGTGQEVVKLP